MLYYLEGAPQASTVIVNSIVLYYMCEFVTGLLLYTHWDTIKIGTKYGLTESTPILFTFDKNDLGLAKQPSLSFQSTMCMPIGIMFIPLLYFYGTSTGSRENRCMWLLRLLHLDGRAVQQFLVRH